MNQEIKAPSHCPVCHAPINEKQGVSTKTNKPYHFWSCSAYPQCTFTWRPPNTQDKNHEEVMSALRSLYTKIEQLQGELKTFAVMYGEKK